MNVKRMFLLGAAVMAAVTLMAMPSVSGEPMLRVLPSGTVEVDYELTAGEDAVVTASFETNTLSDASGTWMPLPDAAVTRISGDVNRLVKPGAVRHLTWQPEGAAPSLSPASLRVVLKPWPVTQPPSYMVVDLRAANTVRYYVSTNALPDGGLSNEIYRRYKLVLRRIPAKDVVWRMGKVNETGWKAAHYVTFASDYYLGIYEVTRHQLRTWGGNQDRSANLLPAVHQQWASMSYGTIRGGNWPTDGKGNVGAESDLKKLQTLTGVGFDLPTAAEWEYACRAGTSGDYNLNRSLREFCWCTTTVAAAGLSGAQPVGTLAPNNWGLYDMHGNILEMCLDRYENAASTYTDMDYPESDPKGSSSTAATTRIARGGSWADGEAAPHQFRCNDIAENTDKSWIGFRLWAPAEAR